MLIKELSLGVLLGKFRRFGGLIGYRDVVFGLRFFLFGI